MQSKRLSGFTLIEVLVVIALLGIVTALAAPGFASLVQSNRVQAAAGELQRALYYARSEAMSRGVNVVITTEPEDTNGWMGALKITTAKTVVLPMPKSCGNTVAGWEMASTGRVSSAVLPLPV